MVIVFTAHAMDQMEGRNVSSELVAHTIEFPEQTVESYGGRRIFQSRYFDELEAKEMLLRVIAELDRENSEDVIVVTVYKTARIERYWQRD